MTQPPEQIEAFYAAKEDPWEYQTNPDDARRKEILISIVRRFGPYRKLLDIGAGEGWITKDYPADVRHGYELSDSASRRMPISVRRVEKASDRDYDIVTATGIMYNHYAIDEFMSIIRNCAIKHVLVSSIKAWESPIVNTIGKVLHHEIFKYREYEQNCRLFEVEKNG